ncbi:hypothetical protein [Pseudomonas putida]|uniref:hypothetical protein n=1 Tax=Pseudomonas putida TaxID=303 RepID=UPI0012D388DC|nr:hypothetical protein [Pseudomonas putida]
MKKLKAAVLVLPFAAMASMAHAAVDLSALDDAKADLALAGGALLAVVLMIFAARRVAGMFGK